jgi:hypothetical protein
MKWRTIWSAAFVAVATLVTSQSSSAQTGRPGADAAPPEVIAPQGRESLSEKLDRTDGVIRPPRGVDPKMATPPLVPDPGTMPVIPAPGSPGGRTGVDPK